MLPAQKLGLGVSPFAGLRWGLQFPDQGASWEPAVSPGFTSDQQVERFCQALAGMLTMSIWGVGSPGNNEVPPFSP